MDQLVRCQDSRLEDQRSPLPVAAVVDSESDSPNASAPKNNVSTVPDEDFFSLIMRFQSGRMEDQRATVPRLIQRFVDMYLFLENHIFTVSK